MADRKFRIVGGTTAGDGGSNPVDPTEPKEMTSAMHGGSDGGSGVSDLEPRVRRLEEDGKEIRSDLKAIMRDLAEMKGAMATTGDIVLINKEIGELKGRLNSLPTTAKLATIVAIIGGVFAIIANWDKVTPVLKSWFGV